VSDAAAYAVTLALVLGAAAVVPWLAMRALVPTLEASGRGLAENYRGRRVVVGLGVVWLVWALALMTAGLIASLYAGISSAWGHPAPVLVFGIEQLPFLLVLGAFGLGMVDDSLGSSADKGFRGHLSALRRGRLTTGALKLLGIGVLAAVSVTPAFGAVDAPLRRTLGLWVLQVLAIALTANLLNLMDLRPGRALKSYSLLAVTACVLIGVSSVWSVVPFFLVVALGPVVAVWGFDLKERGMFGDAGANAAGVLAGWLLVVALSAWWWALAAYVLFAFAMNIASERTSFSAVISRTPALRWLDGLGVYDGRPEDEADSRQGASGTEKSAESKTRTPSETRDR
jgi:UDP-GlcNAc:undecaprenyl-phosphate GlcNAc-1-phosphate transferase